MIYTNRKVTVRNGVSTIDAPVILYRGDKEVEVLFEIIDIQFKFKGNNGNLITNTKASFGQLAIQNPDGNDTFTDIAACEDGHVVFKITGEMIDEIYEVGMYSFHIRLFDEDQSSRITIPHVQNGIEIKEPLVIEDNVGNTDMVGNATVGYSMIQDRGIEEPAFDEEGNYIPTVWNKGDKITAEKLNKVEDAVNVINAKSFSLGIHTDGGIYLFINGKPVGNGIFIQKPDGEVTSDNTFVLFDDLSNGSYTMKYENEDGSYTIIGNFEISDGGGE